MISEPMMKLESVKNPARRAACKWLLLGVGLPFFRPGQAADESTVTLDQLAGEYAGGGGVGGHLIVHAGGRFDWEMTYFSGGDVGSATAASGRLVAEEGAFAVHVDSTAPHSPPGLFPPRLHAVRTCGFIVLLTDGEANWIINAINGMYPRSSKTTRVSGLLHRLLPGATDDETNSMLLLDNGLRPRGLREWVEEGNRFLPPDSPRQEPNDTLKRMYKSMLGIDNKLLVPRMFAHRILSAPLQGKVLGVEEISMPYPKSGMSLIPIGRPRADDPPRPPPKELLVTRLTVDLGAGQGVFEGMALYAGVPQRRMGWVRRVMADRCEMDLQWVNPQEWQPKVGEPVSSRGIND